VGDARDPVEDLKRIAYLLERAREPSYRVRAFRNAAARVQELTTDELRTRVADGSLTELSGVGDVTARCIEESTAGEVPAYLVRLEDTETAPMDERTVAIRHALQGDLHMHSDWSDGGSPIREMAATARSIGHRYVVLTDHSPRLKVANGLTAERLEEQLDVVAELNEEFARDGGPPFRLLTGCEVDILEDGTLDQKPSLLARLDVVVASVHSKLRAPESEMTPRLIAAISNPHTDVLGHCTGRLVVGHGRPESTFDAELVFAACAQFGVAVEINSRPERLDPPKRLLRQAVEADCLISIDTDAHAPGQLDWQVNGCERAAECGVPVESIVNAWGPDDLLAWAGDHAARPA
jgi:putative hydrolase